MPRYVQCLLIDSKHSAKKWFLIFGHQSPQQELVSLRVNRKATSNGSGTEESICLRLTEQQSIRPSNHMYHGLPKDLLEGGLQMPEAKSSGADISAALQAVKEREEANTS